MDKLTDLVLELSPTEETLFLNLYKDDLQFNLDKIGGLVSAYDLVLNITSDSKELLDIEHERIQMIRSVMSRYDALEANQATLSPRTKNLQLRQTYQAFSEAIADHEEMLKRAQVILNVMDRGLIRVSRIMSYGPYLESCQKNLIAARNKLNARFDEKNEEKLRIQTFGKNSDSNNLFIAQPTQQVVTNQPVPMLSSFMKSPTEQILPQNNKKWNFPEEFNPEDAYLLDRTVELHELAKAEVEKNIQEKTQFDLTSLLVYSSSGRELTWASIDQLENKFRLCFDKQMARTPHSGADFKESCQRLKRIVESHMDNCSRYDRDALSGKVGNPYTGVQVLR